MKTAPHPALSLLLVVCTLLVAQPSAHSDTQTPSSKPVTLLFTGDISLAWRDKSYDTTHTPKQIARLDAFKDLLAGADLAIANSEGVLSKEPPPFSTTAMDMWMRPEYAGIFSRNGIDVVSIANNHAYDGFAQGVTETTSILAQHNLHVIGGARSVQDAYKPYIHSLPNGHCIAVLPATTGSNKGRIPISEQRLYNIRHPNKRSPLFPGVPNTTQTPAHLPQEGFIALYPIHQPKQAPYTLETEVQNAKKRCGYVVVYIHWAREKRDQPGSAYEDLAARIMNAGADLIVGHHPHVLQGVDFTSDGRPIVYSLGNTVFANPDPRTRTGGFLSVTLTAPNKAQSEPRFTLRRMELIPFASSMKDYAPKPIKQFKTEELVRRLRKISQRYATSMYATPEGNICFEHDAQKVTWNYPRKSFKNQTPKP